MADESKPQAPWGPPPGAAGGSPRPRRADLRKQRRGRGRTAPAPTPRAPEPSGRGGGEQRARRRTQQPGAGRRASMRRAGRRQLRVKRTLAIVGLVIVGAAAAVLVSELLSPGLLDRARDLVVPSSDGTAPAAGPDAQRSVALVIVDDRAGAIASSIVVLAYDIESDEGTLLLVPVGTVAEVPGHGTFTAGEAYDFGQGPLVWVTVDNILGIELDAVLAVGHGAWASAAATAGGIEVDIGRVLSSQDGRGTSFEPGRQQLTGASFADYLLLRSEGEQEIQRLPRIRQVIDGLLFAAASDPSVLDDLIGPGEASDVELVRDVLADLAEAAARDRVTALTLPVSPLGSGDPDYYRVDRAGIDQLVADRFAASRPDATTAAGTRLQILNGVGVPGIGQQVAEQLRSGGYRIVLTGNAEDFDHAETLIVVYEEEFDRVAVAREIQELLGVGRIERSTTPQTVVDITIVVGSDFAG